MASPPRCAVDGFHLKQVGSRADITERGDVIAERSLLAWNFEIFHQREVVLGQVSHGPTAATDEHENVGGMRAAIGCGPS